MKKGFNIVMFSLIPLLIVFTFIGVHFLNEIGNPIIALKAINGNLKVSELAYEMEKAFNTSYILILSIQIGSILVLIGMVFYNQRFTKILDEHERKVQVAEDNLKNHEVELEKAYAELEKSKKIAERNTKFMAIVQRANTLEDLSNTLINEIAKDLEAGQGAFFVNYKKENRSYTKLVAGYAYNIPESKEITFEFGEGLVGQVARDGKTLMLKDLPEGHIEIISGLGSTQRANLVLVPIKSDEKVLGIVELAFFKKIEDDDLNFLESVAQNIGTKLSVLIN